MTIVRQHLKGRLRPLRRFETLAVLRNLRSGCYALGRPVAAAQGQPLPPVVQVWAALTGTLLGR